MYECVLYKLIMRKLHFEQAYFIISTFVHHDRRLDVYITKLLECALRILSVYVRIAVKRL